MRAGTVAAEMMNRDDSGCSSEERGDPEEQDDGAPVKPKQFPVVMQGHREQRKRKALMREWGAVLGARVDQAADEGNEDFELDE